LAPHLLATAFPSQGLLDAFLFPRLDVKGVFLNLFDDVFL
jgi:hypothetical protein